MTQESRSQWWQARIAAISEWRALDVFFSIVAFFLSVAIIGVALASILSGGLEVTPATLILGWLIGQVVMLGYLYIAFLRRPNRQHALKLGSPQRPLPLYLLIGVALGLSVNLIAAVGRQAFAPAAELQSLANSQQIAWVYAAVFMVLVQPISEQLVFQGIILPKLAASLSRIGGVLITAGIYAALHFAIYVSNPTDGSSQLWHGIVAPFIAGFVYATIRLRTGSTRAAIMANVGAGIVAILTALGFGRAGSGLATHLLETKSSQR